MTCFIIISNEIKMCVIAVLNYNHGIIYKDISKWFKRLVDQIYRYVQFLNMNRKQNQSLYDYTVSLRGKLEIH